MFYYSLKPLMSDIQNVREAVGVVEEHKTLIKKQKRNFFKKWRLSLWLYAIYILIRNSFEGEYFFGSSSENRCLSAVV